MSEGNGDALFRAIEGLQGREHWGSILDAGTGTHSLGWITKLPTSHWTAVTGESALAAKLRDRFEGKLRPEDRIEVGNWQDPLFLHGEVWDTVIADYLLGAVEGFAPYFQDRLFDRLRPHVGRRLYVIGLAPYPDPTDQPWGRIIVEIARLRDAMILLAGHRTYREFPLEWVLRHIESAGFAIDEARVFPIRYGERFVSEQLGVCRKKLPWIADRKLASALEQHIDQVAARARELHALATSTVFGEDWIISACPCVGRP
jgi:hypothetical protein